MSELLSITILSNNVAISDKHEKWYLSVREKLRTPDGEQDAFQVLANHRKHLSRLSVDTGLGGHCNHQSSSASTPPARQFGSVVGTHAFGIFGDSAS